MLRGYRLLIAAALIAAVLSAFGLGSYVTSLAHSAQGESYPSYQSGKSEKDGPLGTIANVSPIKEYRTPCLNPQSGTESDLCAQWKAADAAADSAWWAGFAGWFGGLNFLGVLAAIGLAFHSNRIARDTSNAQLRPYVHGHLIEWQQRGGGGEFYIDFKVKFTNAGQTPAKELQLAAATFFTENGADPPKVQMILGPNLQMQPLGPGCDILTAASSVPFDDLNAVWLCKKRLFIAGIAQYKDNFSSVTRRTLCHYEIRLSKVDGEFNWVWWDYAGSNNEAT